MLQLCPNGGRTAAHVPDTPSRLAADVRASGLGDVHLHPRDAHGAETMEPAHVAAAVAAVRAAAPGVTVGVTTAAWIEPDPARRAALVRSWTVLPDHASVNWHEDGADLVAEALLDRGVGVEAGLFSGTDAAARFLAWPHADRVLRVLAEVTDTDPATAPATAEDLLAGLAPAARPILLHGEEGGAWPVLRLAARLGLPTRIGLEDTLLLPDGSPAPDNTALVNAARAILS
ncbi:3-keto-5-aminohexanoate cleavage protein [Actinomadura kijaniata]|uniref:3-keto-5-aminohexanoate cleavage protein n=1 Tax=Actinomadura kijaniata TaxID=46161 RepID=UPI003F1AA0E2